MFVVFVIFLYYKYLEVIKTDLHIKVTSDVYHIHLYKVIGKKFYLFLFILYHSINMTVPDKYTQNFVQ